jgi:hypothetical protein
MITNRGTPQSGEPIHFQMPGHGHGAFDPYPLCNNGAYHLTWANLSKEVTCEACLARLEQFEFVKREEGD